MERLYGDFECNYKAMSPLTLAFIGDGVYDLLVREQLVCHENYPVGKLNRMKVERVCCQAQAEVMRKLASCLSDEELSVFKRGRNAHTNNIPKNASVEDYHLATGFETLLGYIYLKRDLNRLREIFELTEKIIELE